MRLRQLLKQVSVLDNRGVGGDLSLYICFNALGFSFEPRSIADVTKQSNRLYWKLPRPAPRNF